MPKKPESGIKLRRLEIKNYKIIDSLELEFPPPLMDADLDVIVLGSKNGFGKTSVLECCALLFMALALGGATHSIMGGFSGIDLRDLMIRKGQGTCELTGTVTEGRQEIKVEMSFGSKGGLSVSGGPGSLSFRRMGTPADESIIAQRCMLSLMGVSGDPLLMPPFMFFHSYRKVAEGNPELGMLSESPTVPPRIRVQGGSKPLPTAAFKLELLRSMMSQADLFEQIQEKEEDSLLTLNHLLDRYAGGRIGKLRPSADNTVDFRIFKQGQNVSFSFDGLSSGQKEIISTLYLIWKNTKDNPGIVLIDEPELHLNHEWHSDFIRQLWELAPQNQYIIATHSEEVFRSVPRERRILLEPGEVS